MPYPAQRSVSVHSNHPEAEATHLRSIPTREVFLEISILALLFQETVGSKQENTL
jgi:hypothetical protein